MQWMHKTLKQHTMKQKQGDSWPHHVRWHTKYFENLTAKMTLYFTNILLPRERMLTEDDPEKSLWKGIKIDYYEQLSVWRFEGVLHN